MRTRGTTKVRVRELDLVGIHEADGGSLEVVVDGLPLHAGVQLAIDTTLVGALRGDGTARRGAAVTDGVRLGRCSAAERAQVSSVGGARCQITPRGSWRRGGRQMVRGSDWLLGRLGKKPNPAVRSP